MLDLLQQQRDALRWALSGQGRILVWSGAIRSGKTMGGALAMLLHMERYTGEACILAGKTVSSVQRNILPCVQQFARELGVGYHEWKTKSFCDVGSNRWYLFGAGDSDSQGPGTGPHRRRAVRRRSVTAAGVVCAAGVRPPFCTWRARDPDAESRRAAPLDEVAHDRSHRGGRAGGHDAAFAPR